MVARSHISIRSCFDLPSASRCHRVLSSLQRTARAKSIQSPRICCCARVGQFARLAFRRAANLFRRLVRTLRHRARIDGRLRAGNDANKQRQKNLLGRNHFISVRHRKSGLGSNHRRSRFLSITFGKFGNPDCHLPCRRNLGRNFCLVFDESKFIT